MKFCPNCEAALTGKNLKKDNEEGKYHCGRCDIPINGPIIIRKHIIHGERRDYSGFYTHENRAIDENLKMFWMKRHYSQGDLNNCWDRMDTDPEDRINELRSKRYV